MNRRRVLLLGGGGKGDICEIDDGENGRAMSGEKATSLDARAKYCYIMQVSSNKQIGRNKEASEPS
jgi:hypothetical protein